MFTGATVEANRNQTEGATVVDMRLEVVVVLRDVIQPFPTFSEIYVEALKALRNRIRQEES